MPQNEASNGTREEIQSGGVSAAYSEISEALTSHYDSNGQSRPGTSQTRGSTPYIEDTMPTALDNGSSIKLPRIHSVKSLSSNALADVPTEDINWSFYSKNNDDNEGFPSIFDRSLSRGGSRSGSRRGQGFNVDDAQEIEDTVDVAYSQKGGSLRPTKTEYDLQSPIMEDLEYSRMFASSDNYE